jgi:hypothetical protein
MPDKNEGEKALNCRICTRKPVKNGFCLLHLKAYENIVETYDMWTKALKISWREYLSEIEQNPLTGEWAKEVASYLMNNEGIRNGKES